MIVSSNSQLSRSVTLFYSVASFNRPYHTDIHPSEFRKDPTGVDVHCALCTLMLGLEHKKVFVLCKHKIKFIEQTPYKGVYVLYSTYVRWLIIFVK
jgi:hypothetical protein